MLAIATAHAGLVVLLLRGGMLNVPAKPVALTVNILPLSHSSAPLPRLAPPSVTRMALPLAAQPEFYLPADTALIASAAASATTTLVSPISSSEGAQHSSEANLPAMSEIAYLRQPAPHYPPGARHAREEGLVILQVEIDECGRVQRVAIYRSSGHPRLDEAARDAVALALFKPYAAGGVARAAIAMIPIEFSLRGS